MGGKFRLVILCSEDRSDLFFANKLAERFDPVGIFVESQRANPSAESLLQKYLRLAKAPHQIPRKIFNRIAEQTWRKNALYNRSEHKTDFGEAGRRILEADKHNVIFTTGANRINAPEYIERLREMRPDLVVVCGASILGDEFLSVPKFGVLNLHGGLSQRYRGLFTTEWAVYNAEPEYVGGTVHFVAPGIDDGQIVYQGRPLIEANDSPNTLYEKVVHLGVEMMGAAIEDLRDDRLAAVELQQPGALYTRSMFTPQVLKETWRQFERGVISDYSKNKCKRDVPVIRGLINEFEATSNLAKTSGRTEQN
ncbi:formyl transferase [Marinobacter salarius]|jgi:methionyl-tRNA formyltransferase|uniref:formyl transferase n=1 Tax=Marinobacter salarius TaxID=1420917 RepID=UPI003BAA92B9